MYGEGSFTTTPEDLTDDGLEGKEGGSTSRLLHLDHLAPVQSAAPQTIPAAMCWYWQCYNLEAAASRTSCRARLMGSVAARDRAEQCHAGRQLLKERSEADGCELVRAKASWLLLVKSFMVKEPQSLDEEEALALTVKGGYESA